MVEVGCVTSLAVYPDFPQFNLHKKYDIFFWAAVCAVCGRLENKGKVSS